MGHLPLRWAHAPRRPRHRIQHGPPARGRRAPVGRAAAGLLHKSRCAWPSTSTSPARSPRRASTRSPTSAARPCRSPRTRAARTCSASPRRRVRDAPNSDDVLAAVNDVTGVDLDGAVGRGRGAADLPRRTALVRLVGRPAGGLRHRRRLARDRRRRRRGARRRAVAAARRRPGSPATCSAATRPTTRRCAGCASRSAPTSPATRATCCAPARPTTRRPPPRRSARSPGSAVPRRAATGRSCRPQPGARRARATGSPSSSRMTADERADLPGVSAQPLPPDPRRRARGRGDDGPLRPGRSSRSARGRCARASSCERLDKLIRA